MFYNLFLLCLITFRLPQPPVGYQPQYVDLTGDGKPDAIKSETTNRTPVLWLDDDHDMKAGDMEGDTDNDCLLIDRNKDGRYGFWGDLIIDWIDSDNDGKADMQVAIEYPDSLPGKAWPNGHYMWVLDTDHDGIFNYIDFNTFKFRNWDRVGISDFYTDYSGNSAFLKIHTYTASMADLRLNWENPFLFYDPDGDHLSEMAIRMVDTPQYTDTVISGRKAQKTILDGKTDWVSVAVDMDNDNAPGNSFDFDLTLRYRGSGFDYMAQRHPIHNIRGLAEADTFFLDPSYRKLTELIYPGHKEAPALIKSGKWNEIFFTYDEDDDCNRWERVELLEPLNPFKIGSGKGGIDHNSQSDAAGDRGEWDMDASGRGKLYIGNFDGRLHLYGAEWGCWRIDQNATAWQGFDRNWLKAQPAKFETVKYTDTDRNGFFDKIEYDLDGDTVYETAIDFRKEGIGDACELIDVSDYTYAGYCQLQQKVSRQMWANAQMAVKAAKKYNINTDWYAKLLETISPREEYNNGYWLQFYIYRDLQNLFLRRKDEKKLKTLTKAYYTSRWELIL